MHVKIKMSLSDVDALKDGASLVYYGSGLGNIVIEIGHDTDYLKEEVNEVAIIQTDDYEKLSILPRNEPNKAL